MKPFTLNHVVVQQLVFTLIQSFTCVHVRVKNAKVESSLNTDWSTWEAYGNHTILGSTVQDGGHFSAPEKFDLILLFF